MVLAALVGAGAAVGTDALLDGGGAAPAAGGSTSSSVIVNDQDEVNADTAAICDKTGGQMVKLPVRQSTARRSTVGTSSQPSRQPVIA